MFSDREQEIIKIIGKKKLTLKDIAKELFKDTKTLDTHIKTGNAVRKIIEKCDFHCLPWTLTKRREDRKLYIKKEKVR